MKEKPRGLSIFEGMSWSRAKRELDMNAHMLILDENNDPYALRVVQSYRDFGLDIGAATLAIVLFIKRYGASTAACEAVRIYRDIIKEVRGNPQLKEEKVRKLDNFEFALGQMESWIYYSHPRIGELKWPLEPKFEKVNERGGLANIMLYLSMLDLADEGSTTSLVAAQGIQRFIEKDRKSE